MSEVERIRRERAALQAKYGELFHAISAALFRDDPMGINFEVNTDEYEPEVGTILPRLSGCRSKADVVRVVHEEFGRWFGVGAGKAGPIERYAKVGGQIWRLWCEHVGSPS